MKNIRFLLGLSLSMILLSACNMKGMNNQSEDIPKTKYNIITKKNTPYLDLYFGNTETILQYTFVEYPTNSIGERHLRERNVGDNTIMLTEKVGIQIHDEYSIINEGNNAHFQITRDAGIVRKDSKGKAIHVARRTMYEPYSFPIYVQAVDSIHIIRPSTDECHCIPMCYYEDMEIEWNPDYSNTNGVLIIIEWNGITLTDNLSSNGTTIGIDIVEDTGVTTLNNDLFDNIPDEALVNLWLLRANVVDISHVGDGTIENLISLANEDPDMLQMLLDENPEYMLALQDITVGCGAVAMLPFYLIRNL